MSKSCIQSQQEMELLTVLRLQLDLLLDSAHAVKLEIDPHKHT